jgi:proteic killer suppression protein
LKNIVELTPEAQKKIKKLPNQVIIKLKHWVNQVELLRVRRVMQVKGFHNESSKGKRKGQRSIRLNKAYRAFYRKLPNGDIEIIEVFDINKHEY